MSERARPHTISTKQQKRPPRLVNLANFSCIIGQCWPLWWATRAFCATLIAAFGRVYKSASGFMRDCGAHAYCLIIAFPDVKPKG